MSVEEQNRLADAALLALRRLGYAVAVFSPEELYDCPTHLVEVAMLVRGREVISA